MMSIIQVPNHISECLYFTLKDTRIHWRRDSMPFFCLFLMLFLNICFRPDKNQRSILVI